jgi:DNA-binding LacI/PurR family transcriptional regulator
MLDSDPTGSQGAATVNLDIADGVRQVTDHLLELGHRRFLHLAADIPSWTFEVRARELASRLCEAPGTSLRVTRAPISFEDALTATQAALTTPGPRPTAVICDDDKLAAGAYKAARRLGLRIPDDISITGLDDLALARALDPELTTVRLDAERFGEQGMKALLAVLDGRTPPQEDIPVELVVRGSTAPPSA